jgi:SAM-dependent methyltransferase
MLDADGPNAGQIAYWNSVVGENWVALQAQLDRQIEPLGLAVIETLAPAVGDKVIDIGCGCGQTTLDLARRVGATGQVLGVDLSRGMLEVARVRAEAAGLAQARFAEADAQTYAFEPGGADGAFSRFGVMFFADPPAAFANIRRGLKAGGRLAFLCWRSPAENPVMSLPLEAAAPHLPPLPPRDPTAPGPFAFAERGRIEDILSRAGFSEVRVSPHDQPLTTGGLDQATDLALRIGPLGTVLRENPALRAPIEPLVRAALAAHETPQGVFLASATWIVTARNG